MTEIITGVTFSPVQTFIEKSRKLRDLYGSSYLLSYLSWSVCHAADQQGHTVISPALPNVTQGMPNKILIAGDFSEEAAKTAFLQAWECVTDTCQEWVRAELELNQPLPWKREWGLWAKYAWEFFWVQGDGLAIGEVRRQLEAKKQARNWVGINWQGESSTLSGTDAVAHLDLGKGDPRKNYQEQKRSIEEFYEHLSRVLGEAFIDPDEELSIPELTKRLITSKEVAEAVVERLKTRLGEHSTDPALEHLLKTIGEDLNPESFRDLNRLPKKRKTLQGNTLSHSQEEGRWTGWFHGDGDRAGNHLDTLDSAGTHKFSEQMRQWGETLQANPPQDSRVIYAGGDDFLGVFYRVASQAVLSPQHCVDYFSRFKRTVWDAPVSKPITVSVGFVWAAPNVPQRDVLQHCREAEKSAKNSGRDRIAFRVLFNSGNHLEWVCCWDLLEEGLLRDYRDRNGVTGDKANWTHFYRDVAALEARHAFEGNQTEVALALFGIYFPHFADKICLPAGSLNNSLNGWIINLAKVGFHLCSPT